MRVSGSASPANRGRYCSRDGLADFAGLAVVLGVVPPHHALQLRKFAHHRGEQIALGELRRAAGELRIAPDGHRDRRGKRAHALGLVVERAKPRLEGHALQALAPRGERLLQVLGVEERGVGEAGSDDALVARDYLRGIRAVDIRDRDEPGHQAPLRVAHREIALMILHRRDRNVFRQLEEARLELPGEPDRPFDQGGDLVEEPILDHRLTTDGPRGLGDLATDHLAAPFEIGQHPTTSLQGREIRSRDS